MVTPRGRVEGLKGTGSTAGSVVLVKVLPAFGSFGAPCWLCHDDLERETKSDMYLSRLQNHWEENTQRRFSSRVLKGDTSVFP